MFGYNVDRKNFLDKYTLAHPHTHQFMYTHHSRTDTNVLRGGDGLNERRRAANSAYLGQLRVVGQNWTSQVIETEIKTNIPLLSTTCPSTC